MPEIRIGRAWRREYELAHRVFQHDQAQEAGDWKEAERIKRYFRENEGYVLSDFDDPSRVRLRRA
jgi:hypothetical protein